MKKLLGALAWILMTTLLVSCAPQGTQPVSTADAPGETEGQAATQASLASFTSTTLDGKNVDQSIFAGYQLTMINIWATFCGPCLTEMPELGELAQEYADRDVQIIGIVIDVLDSQGNYSEGQLELAREIVKRTGADYPHLLPSLDLISAKLKDVSSVPETIFVDGQGNPIGRSYIGARDKASWQTIIDGYLEEGQ